MLVRMNAPGHLILSSGRLNPPRLQHTLSLSHVNTSGRTHRFMYCRHVRACVMLAPPSWLPSTGLFCVGAVSEPRPSRRDGHTDLRRAKAGHAHHRHHRRVVVPARVRTFRVHGFAGLETVWVEVYACA
jgi:hypothetical protein